MLVYRCGRIRPVYVVHIADPLLGPLWCTTDEAYSLEELQQQHGTPVQCTIAEVPPPIRRILCEIDTTAP